MDGNSINIPFQQFASPSELSAEEQQLLELAWAACDHAYAPYSGFHVGCAVLLANGEVVTANNQENKAFPSGLCAERVALFNVGAQSKGEMIRKIAIRGRSNSKPVEVPVTPCGACRQVMLEYEKMAQHPFEIIMQGESGKILKLTGVAQSLLPFGFDIEF